MITVETNRPQSAGPSFQRQPGISEPLPGEQRVVGSEARPLPVLSPIPFAIVAFGATVASIYGLGAGVLSILGLSGVLPITMAAVATLVIGVSFLFFGRTALAAARLRGGEVAVWPRLRFWGGMVAATLAGLAGVILGILWLVFPALATFGAIMAIVFGAALLEGTGLTLSGAVLPSQWFLLGRYGTLAAETVVGVGAIVLGVLALLHVAPLLFVLISLLAVGLTTALATSTLCGMTLAGRECR